jgi:hypothetical protein
MLEMRLAYARGLSLHEFRERTPSAEYPLWVAFLSSHGFPDARLEAVAANGLAAVCCRLGSKVSPKDLLPRVQTQKVIPWKEGKEILKAWAKAHNKRRRNGK